MRTLECIIILFAFDYSNAECVASQPFELLCVNEFEFESVYSNIKTLTLADSFIAHDRLRVSFPDVRTIYVQGAFVHDQCVALKNTDYTLVGCLTGDRMLLNFYSYVRVCVTIPCLS